MGIPTEAPAATDPFVSVYPSMAPKQAPPAPKASVLPPDPATVQKDPFFAVYPSMEKTAKPAEPSAPASDPAPAEVSAEDPATDGWDARADQEWPAAVAADPEIGGSNQPAAIAAARAVVDRYAPPELVAELKRTGYGSFPPLVKLLSRIGKDLGTKDGRDALRKLYSSMPNA